MMVAVKDLAEVVGVVSACDALAIPRATYYRWLRPKAEPKRRPTPPRALRPKERRVVRELLNSEEFVDQAPAQVYASLLDRGTYLCSVRTMYRILAQHGEVKERRDQLRHPEYTKPELLATGPNQVWSWDITKLLGPAKWTYYHLYVIIDIFSRYVVGWLLAERESAALAKRLIEETIDRQDVAEDQLTLHSDRGPSMKSSTVAQLLADLGVTKSHSRPYTSNDNPFSEAHFKTLKYRPEFPKRFGSMEDGRAFCRSFFPWYNNAHRHSRIGLVTPFEVHHGLAQEVYQRRQQILRAAYRSHPERFVRKTPEPPPLPEAVWINPPAPSTDQSHTPEPPTSTSGSLASVRPLVCSLVPEAAPHTPVPGTDGSTVVVLPHPTAAKELTVAH
jgi:putative transposase